MTTEDEAIRATMPEVQEALTDALYNFGYDVPADRGERIAAAAIAALLGTAQPEPNPVGAERQVIDLAIEWEARVNRREGRSLLAIEDDLADAVQRLTAEPVR